MAKQKEQLSSLVVLQTVKWMRKNGFRPVPLHHQSKAAIFTDYLSPDYKPPADELWMTHDYGVGCVTGPAHGGPVDVDLDTPEAAAFAPFFFPPTKAVFGRASKPRSHFIYRVDTATFAKMTFIDPITGKVALELRGDKHQTVFPGSLHQDTGEQVTWSADRVEDIEISTVTDTELIHAAQRTMLAQLISTHAWAHGFRNQLTLLLAGTFAYLEWTLAETEHFIEAIMAVNGDTDKTRIPTVRNTYRKKENNERVAGQGILRKQLKNDALVDEILRLAGSPSVLVLNEYNERYAAGDAGGKFRIARTNVPPGEQPVLYAKDDWLELTRTDYSDERDPKGLPIPKAKLWLNSPQRRTFDRIDFLPGVEDTGNTINLWTGWPIEPKEGDCSAWMELLYNVICGEDDELFWWCKHWFANIIREPRSKPMTALVIIGPEGAGKTLLLSYFGRMLGNYYSVVTKEEHIHGKFNQHMGSVLLLHSEEALWGGDRKHAGTIKSLISDVKQMQEAKFQNAQQINSYLRLVMTTNETRAAAARSGDRRHTVIDMMDRKIDDDLLQRVLAELENGGPAALFHELMTMEYDPKIPRTNIKNDALIEIKRQNLDATETWWYETLVEGAIVPDDLRWATKPSGELDKEWPAVVSGKALYVAFTIRCQSKRIRGPIPSEMAFAMQLDKMLGMKTLRDQHWFAKPMRDRDEPRFHPEIEMMSERQRAILNMPSLKDCRDAFSKHMGQTIDWGPDSETDRPAPGPKF